MKKNSPCTFSKLLSGLQYYFDLRSKFLICIVILPLGIYAQTTTVSGIINNYAGVTSIVSQDCSTVLGIDNSSGFRQGDTVIIIQMKGAVVDTSNTAAFGNVINLNGAGHYEFGFISSISGNLVYLSNALGSTFDVNGSIQMIRVANYTNITVTAPLTAKKWDGVSGGVLALFVSGTITMYADIDISGKGFRGGNISNNPDGNCGTGSPDFFYPLSQGNVPQWNSGGAEKGEGIAVLHNDKMAGKGKLANGGGGGNKHNYGGGGGSNYTAAGIGGNSLDGCGIGDMGIGGASLASYIVPNTLFVGGGGGCGDFNNNVGSIGADGGGIAIIKAGTLNANGHKILANGNDELVIGYGIADGVGGGGGGGSLYIDIANFTSPVSLGVNGGYGGDQNPTYGCVGTGGGGGTGVIFLTAPTLPSMVNISNYPGRAGLFLSTFFSGCAGTSYGATAGDSAHNGVKTGTSPLIDLTNSCLCKLTIPNAFSPNGDGKNDLFQVVYQCPIQTFSMRIYERSGALVYSSHSINDGWDGTFKGAAQPQGIYVVMISYVDPYTNNEKSMSSEMTLFR
jgi:gliding motility-associated-like protein